MNDSPLVVFHTVSADGEVERMECVRFDRLFFYRTSVAEWLAAFDARKVAAGAIEARYERGSDGRYHLTTRRSTRNTLGYDSPRLGQFLEALGRRLPRQIVPSELLGALE